MLQLRLFRLLFILILMPGIILADKPTIDKKFSTVDIQTFAQVIGYIKEHYVTPINEEVLLQHAARGMLASLDPHSAYLDKDDFEDLKISVTGELAGLGVKVVPDGKLIRIVNTIDGGPAERGGVKSGDGITHLNNKSVIELSPREAIKRIRGKKGTQVTLTINRSGETKPLKLCLTRDIITVHSVRSELLEKEFAYLKISEFQTNSGEDVTHAVQTLKKTAGKLKGLILDLRNNPGGAVESAVQIADAFLDRDKLSQYEGVIVYAKSRTPRSRFKERAHVGDILNGTPLVVLVNQGSASASEIVAGALQDYHRAIIVGTQTFGKGSVQTLLPLEEEQALKLTTALYYTPSGRSIQATGIVPDILIQNINMPSLNLNEKKDKAASLLCSDNQLNQALNVLKGVTLMQGASKVADLNC